MFRDKSDKAFSLYYGGDSCFALSTLRLLAACYTSCLISSIVISHCVAFCILFCLRSDASIDVCCCDHLIRERGSGYFACRWFVKCVRPS